MRQPRNISDGAKTLGATDLTYAEAVAIQKRLRDRLILAPPEVPPAIVAGTDVAFAPDRSKAIAGFVLFSWPELDVVDVAAATAPADFPYVPGLLSFREIPALLTAYRRLSARPGVIFCDGQGIAHPRRFGLASHLGVLLDTPSIGCAKSVLVGEFDEPAAVRGAASAMLDSGDQIGLALRTRDNVRPLYVSPGHRMDFETAAAMVLAAGRGYRLPEPTRAAHNLVARVKAAMPAAR